jgi:hypothetical protein
VPWTVSCSLLKKMADINAILSMNILRKGMIVAKVSREA